jgi:hypothetical protein
VTNGVKETGVEDIGHRGLVGDRAENPVNATTVWVLLLARAARRGGAARPAHQFDDVGDGGVAEGSEHASDEFGRDERTGSNLDVHHPR